MKKVLVNTSKDKDKLLKEAEARRKAFQDQALLVNLHY
jgi:hypothetical protein